MALGIQFKYSDEGERQGGEAWQQGVKESMGRRETASARVDYSPGRQWRLEFLAESQEGIWG